MAQYIGYSTVNNEFQSVRLTDTELVKRDLLNTFAIRKGEKLHNPEFGSSVVDLVMEPLTEQVKNLILEEINRVIDSEPRVRPENIIVDEYENGIQVDISLTYVQNNLTERMIVLFNRQDGTVRNTQTI